MQIEPNEPSRDSVVQANGPLNFEHLVFTSTQKIVQLPGETSGQLHERLREEVVHSFNTIKKPTKIKSDSWYTFDASKILGIPGAGILCTFTCKHEPPYQLIVGIRKPGWMKSLPKASFQKQVYEYTLYPIDKELTEEDKNKIYDAM